jgi:hypothetical protein
MHVWGMPRWDNRPGQLHARHLPLPNAALLGM